MRLVVDVVLGHGEGAADVAVVVDDVLGDGAVVEAVDDGLGPRDPLRRRHRQREDQDEERRGAVVAPVVEGRSTTVSLHQR